MNSLSRVLAFLLVVAAGFTCQSTVADEVVIQYEARIATIVGTPFGLDITDLNSSVNGFFQYESTTPDMNASSERGDYAHDPSEGGFGGGGFAAVFSPNSTAAFSITGSDIPLVNIEDFVSSETFRFRDGPDAFSPGGIMSLDGSLDANIRMTLAMSDSTASSFADDSLPESVFPMSIPDGTFPHTFAISEIDTGDIVLLQFNSFQSIPEPGSVAVFIAGLLVVRRKR